MSRINECEPDSVEEELRGWAFEGNVRRAVVGKKGQKFLRELETALLALPEKRLAQGVMAAAERDYEAYPPPAPKATGEVCALGVIALARTVAAGVPLGIALQELAERYDPEEDGWEIQKRAARQLKICHPLAYAVIFQNDECNVKTPEERYESVLAWVRRALGGDNRYWMTRP